MLIVDKRFFRDRFGIRVAGSMNGICFLGFIGWGKMYDVGLFIEVRF